MNAIDELQIRYGLSSIRNNFERLDQDLTAREIYCAYVGLDYDAYRTFICAIAYARMTLQTNTSYKTYTIRYFNKLN